MRMPYYLLSLCIVTILIATNGLTVEGQTIEPVFPGATWATKTPAEAGMDSAKLTAFANYLGGRGCVVRHGYMVHTWGTQSTRADIASACKPFYSHFVFKALEEGRIPGLDQTINTWEPRLNNLNASLGYKDRNITWKHIANQMACYGLRENPGSAFVYNDFQMALLFDTLFLNVYGASYSNVDANVFHPLLTDILQCQDGPTLLAFGTSDRPGRAAISVRDHARFGLLYLNEGNWKGTQVISEAHAREAVRSSISNSIPRTTGVAAEMIAGQRSIGSTTIPDNQTDHMGSYSYLWWTNGVDRNGVRNWPDAPMDTFGAMGHGGRRCCVVIPSLDIVVAWNDATSIDTIAEQSEALRLLTLAVNGGVQPMPEQIAVDATNPSWFKRQNVGPFFMCGPGDPEDFLYRGTRNSDGTRNGDQMALINKMKGTGANSIYMQVVRSHGGDGDATHNPFTNSDPTQPLDQDILNQWEDWFAEMDKNNITAFLFFYDDGARIWSTGDTVSSTERAFIQGIVNRFKHHRNLIWSVAEEYAERYSATRVSNIAAEIRAADTHKHPIAVHKNSGLDFSEFANNAYIDQFAIQYNVATAGELHSGMTQAWSAANGRYNLNMSECADHGTGPTARKNNWAVAMGGAYSLVLYMDIAGTALSDLQDCGRLVSFFESTNFNEMYPRDDLAYGGTQYVLAKPGSSYIAYASNLAGNIGVRAMTAGTYSLTWFDCVTGATVTQSVPVAGGDTSWPKPVGIGSELAVYINGTGAVQWDSLGIQQMLGNGITPGIATDSAGGIHVVYMSNGGIYYRKADSSAVFGAAEQIPSPEGSGSYNSPHVVVDADDVPHVVFAKDWTSSSKKAWYTNRIGGSWKTPVVALAPPPTDHRVNYPRLAVYNSNAYVGAFVAGPSVNGKVARLINLPSTPSVTRTVDTALWVPTPVVTSDGKIFMIGRNGASGHYVQEYDLSLNTVGSWWKISTGTQEKTGEGTAAIRDSSNVIHAAGVTAATDFDHDQMWYNSSQRISESKTSILGLDGPSGGAVWSESVYPTLAADANDTIYLTYRDYGTGQGKTTVISGDQYLTPITFATGVTGRLRWNPHAAPAPNGGIYVVWDNNDIVYFRPVGVGSGAADNDPPGTVTIFSAAAGDQAVTLSWTNPSDSDFTGTMIRYKTNGYPTSPSDGTLVVNKAGIPGTADSFMHTGLPGGVACYYGAFAHDAKPNYSTGQNATATPAGYCFGDKFGYSDGNLIGQTGWAGTAGSEISIEGQKVKITGGSTNTEVTKLASCPGTGGIIVARAKVKAGEGDLTMWGLWFDDASGNNLGRWYGKGTTARGRIGGTSTVTAEQNLLPGDIWNSLEIRIDTAANTSEFFLNGNTMGVLNHTATPGNSVGEVRIERVYNSIPANYIYLDDIAIGDYEADPPSPVTGFSAVGGVGQVMLGWTNPNDSDFAGTIIRYRTDAYPSSFTDGTLVTNRLGAPGSVDSFTHTGLSQGVTCYYSAFAYDGDLIYSSKVNASATPLVGVCFMESFTFGDGNLVGNNGWSGNAASEIAVDAGTLKVTGGTGMTEAVKTISCSGVGGIISVRAGIKAGSGVDTMWSLYIDDAAGLNLARWYGAGTTARGRIGGTSSVTATKTLTGPGAWDDLEILINTVADTSQFFFNGLSIGTLSHASQGAGNAVGRIKFERVDNYMAANNTVYFDNIVVGSPDTTAPGAVSNLVAIGASRQIALTWTNPADADLAGTVLRFKTGSYPTSQTDGAMAYTGTATSYTHTGLNNGTRYFYSAFAFDGADNYSTKADAAAHAAADAGILEAKGLADSQVRALRGNVVSAVGSGYFYLQDPNVLQGIKAFTNEAATEGQMLDVIGVMQGSGAERWMDITGNRMVVTDPGPVALESVGMSAASVGGSTLNALVPGIAGGIGPNNIGLLVTVWGKVTQRDNNLAFFYIDDGSALRDGTTTEVSPGVFEESVGVRVLANPTSYASGSYVTVTGAVSTFSAGELRPQVLPVENGVNIHW